MTTRTRPAASEPEADGRVSARAAGLRYSTDARPGITRRRTGRGFSYRDRRRRDDPRRRDVLRRIRALADPAGLDGRLDLPRSGRPSAGDRARRARPEAVPLPRRAGGRDATTPSSSGSSTSRRSCPRSGRRCDADLGRPGLPREKVLAAVVRLLELTLIRVGNDEYARLNRSFGLTTLREPPRDGRGDRRSGSGSAASPASATRWACATARLAAVIRRCQDLPGQELFQYVDDDGVPHDVGSEDVNAYLREISGADVTAKDFRTWAGTVLAYRALRALAARGRRARGAAQRGRGRPADRGTARQHAGRRPTELRPSRDPRGVSRRRDRRRAPRGGRGAARPALRPGSPTRSARWCRCSGPGCALRGRRPPGRKAPDRRPHRTRVRSDAIRRGRWPRPPGNGRAEAGPCA